MLLLPLFVVSVAILVRNVKADSPTKKDSAADQEMESDKRAGGRAFHLMSSDPDTMLWKRSAVDDEAAGFDDLEKRPGGRLFYSRYYNKRGGARAFGGMLDKRGGARAFGGAMEKRPGARSFMSDSYMKRLGARVSYYRPAASYYYY